MKGRQVGMKPFSCRHLLLGMLPLVGIMLTGCMGVLQDYQEGFHDFMTKPDPVEVVQKTPSGDRRAKFLHQIQEPLENGGTQAEQDEVVNLLIQTATNDPYPICRLAAIRTLGRFKDPRAVQGLQAAYYQSTPFMPDINNKIKQQTLVSLGETGHPEAKELLIRVARAGAEEKDSLERRMTLDERLAAIRALSEYKDPDVTQTLVHIMKTEKDVALRERANQSFETVTGNRLPEDPQALDQALQSGNIATVSDRNSNPIYRLLSWTWR